MASPWEIGSAHWNQRDLYTKNGSIEDDGYGAGPRLHPEVGSYAYVRDVPPEPEPPPPRDELYAREAWPWLNYHPDGAHAPHGSHARASDASIALHRFLDRIVTAFAGRRRELTLADEHVLADVRGALAARRDVDTRDIEVEASGGAITLKGSVPTRAMKERAEEVARACPGVACVHNKLRVRRDDDVLFLMPIEVLGFT